MMNPHADFHEIWWIYSPAKEEWAGLRIAHFRKAMGGELLVFITGEMPERIGPRVWLDITDREQWSKVKQIAIPTPDEVRAAVEARR